MLARAFPPTRVSPETSPNAIAERAAPVLGISHRQARRLVNGECSAKVGQVLAVVFLLGVELTLTVAYGSEHPPETNQK